MKFGYQRVSTKEQNLARQEKALTDFGVDIIYSDKASGKDFNRVDYQRMIEQIKTRKERHLIKENEKDCVVIKSLDRLGRDYDEIGIQWKYITTELNCDIVVLDMPLISTTGKDNLESKFLSDVMFSLLSYISENERQKILARQREGIEAAKLKGKYKGRKPIAKPSNWDDVVGQWVKGEITAKKAMNELNMTSPTFYRKLKEMGIKKEA